MNRREELLAAIKATKCTEFVELVKLHNCRNDTFDLDEIIQCLSRQQYSEMWDGINEMCTKVLMSFDLESELDEGDPQVELLQHNVEVVTGITTIALCSINGQEPVVTNSLLQVAVMLHGILLDLPQSCSKLQYLIAQLCETWFLADLDGKALLVTCMIPYFIIKSLRQGLMCDVKRLWSIRQGLLLLDFEDESCTSTKTLLQQCLFHLVFLRVEEGRKFLSYLFGMHPAFIDDLHKTIKNQLPSCPIATLVFYGEIYFKAWRAAKDLYLQKIEVSCIQDLMFHAVHAQRTGRYSMASRLKKVLGYFHQHKKHPEVDKVLLKLYEPIIWRACKVTNPSVRANAAAILFDVFPLRDPDANVAESDQLMQRQFDMIGDFLDDPSPNVRATAVHGVFQITALYWEWIPAHIVKELITKIVETAAYDVSSTAVRVAVCEGINYALDNRLSHPLLKTLLPNLKNVLHDNSEKVRKAFLDVLLKIKGMRAIKFWTITPMEHLLGRLEVEQSSPAIRRLVKLLMNSFHPANKENDELLTRCVGLWNKNAAAARKFYQYAHLQMSLPAAGKFLLLLCSYVLQYSKKQKNDDETGESNDSRENVDKENDENVEQEGTEEDDSDVNIATIAGLLETCAIIWGGIKEQLEKPSQENLKNTLTQNFAKAAPKLFKSLKDDRSLSALTFLAANLPPDLVPMLSLSYMEALSSMTDEMSSDVYGPLLECLCSWGKAGEVIELIDERIQNALQDNLPKSGTGRKRKSVNFSLPLTKSCVALHFLDWLMESQSCRTRVFKAGDHLKNLTETMSSTVNSIEGYLNDFNESSTTKEKGEFLKKAFETYCHLRIHLWAKENESSDDKISTASHENVTLAYEQILTWCERALLQHIDNVHSATEDESGTERVKRGKYNQQWQPEDFVISILKSLLNLCSDLVMLGVSKTRLHLSVANFTSSLVKFENTFTLLPEIAKLTYQIAQEIIYLDDDGTVHFNPIKIIFGNIIKLATSYHHPDKLQILMSIRPALCEIVNIFHQNNRLISLNVNNTLMMIMVEAIIKEVVDALKENSLITGEVSMESLPVTTNFLLDFILKSKFLFRIWVKEVNKCITSGIIKDRDYEAIAYLLLIFINDGKVSEGMKSCLSEIEKAVERLVDENHEIPPYISEAKRLTTESYKKLNEIVC